MTYTKNGQTLEESDRFLYLEEIFLSYPRRWELSRSQIYSSKTPVKGKNSRIYRENRGCYIQRFWELIAAPKQYLISQGFKPKL